MDFRISRPEAGQGWAASGRAWTSLVMPLLVRGREMMPRDSLDLWYRSSTSPSDASEDAGAFGSVCEPLGAVTKKSVKKSQS